jgi:hypothetical protein
MKVSDKLNELEGSQIINKVQDFLSVASTESLIVIEDMEHGTLTITPQTMLKEEIKNETDETQSLEANENEIAVDEFCQQETQIETKAMPNHQTITRFKKVQVISSAETSQPAHQALIESLKRKRNETQQIWKIKKS